MMFNNLGIYASRLYRRIPVIGRKLAQPAQISSSIGGYGNDIINVGTITSVSIVPVTSVTITPFTPTSQEYFLCVDVNGPATIRLPASVVGKVYVVKDCDGDAAINPITITAIGSTIDGSASAIINSNYGSLSFVFNGAEWSID